MTQPIMKIKPKHWLDRLSQALLREPQDKEQLLLILRDAENRQLIDADTLSMLESVMLFSELKARDIMIPRQQMTVVSEHLSLEPLVKLVKDSGHSRFPVTGDSQDDILGILHAKDLLAFRLNQSAKFDLDDLIRPATIVPESKKLNILLTEFRLNRNHMAIVVDEYGGVTGFVTIEDVLEQIVGDIEDEFDNDEDAFVKMHANGSVIVKAHMPIDEFNEQLELQLAHDEFDTVGGLLIKQFGHLPKSGEVVMIDECQFKIISADNRRIKLIELQRRV